MEKARLNAGMATCIRRQVGAVAVIDNRQIADGFNGNLPGELHCNEGGCDRCVGIGHGPGVNLDRCVCVHAETNLVAFSARYGLRIAGATVYVTTRPCTDCYKLLASAGVIEVVYDDEYPESQWFPETKRMTLRSYRD